ncbi:hypothetical protein D3C76_1484380 [compost metagenome]
MTLSVTLMVMEVASIGIFRKRISCQRPAPSILPASSISSGTVCNPAKKMIVLVPIFFQISTPIMEYSALE